ncbi:type 4a pilus biogenesis protein PilO [Paenibacillus senegalimassiliensis]|uniref:type 4a pilus biogenesis protein PilO n=1 Tax=Paenibacillus senegalimassiliensis TaxID=1737426 RepID=UPI00073F766F|nr:type 4a pilus biogenesis protein PilO [Paenibacillus senegalimassiliensis]
MTFLADTQVRRGFTIGCAIFLLLVAYFYLVRPSQVEREVASQMLLRKQQEYQLLLNNSSNFKEEAAKGSYELALIRQIVPEQAYTDQLLEQMKRLETVSGVQMKGYQFALADTQAGEAATGLRKVTMTTSLTGTYAQFVRLLKEIHGSTRLLTLDKLELNVVQENADILKKNVKDPEVACQLSIAAYYAPELASFGQFRKPAAPQEVSGRSQLLY